MHVVAYLRSARWPAGGGPLNLQGGMLTRLRVSGFKNLLDVDVAFGPFTCVAGPNASGKSNLFDAIAFLSYLADRPLMDAASAIRGEAGLPSDVRNLFHRVGEHYTDTMSFRVEMIVPAEGIDDLGQAATASTTFLEYSLTLRYRSAPDLDAPSELEVVNEELNRLLIGDATKHLKFDHSVAWRRSALQGRRQNALISTEDDNGKLIVKVHQDQRSGRTRQLLASKLPRTALSSSSAAETPTALLARREMQSWRELQLEPSALREPDSFRAPTRLLTDGRHLPATIAYLTEMYERQRPGGSEDFLARLANRLAELIEDVRRVAIDRDHRRELITLNVEDRLGTNYAARSLSDGTLRFLALCVIEADPRFGGVLCLEEPENGIHPARIKPMLDLLHDIAVDVYEPVGDDNPLRQVIINTHSPSVVGQVMDDELLMSLRTLGRTALGESTQANFRWLSETWRARADASIKSVSRGLLLSFLNPPAADSEAAADGRGSRSRVIDRPDIRQLHFPLAS